MIDRSLLEPLLPEDFPDVPGGIAASWGISWPPEDPFVARAEAWAIAIQAMLREYFNKHGPVPTDAMYLIGIGFIYVPDGMETELARAGLGFGVVVYSFGSPTEPVARSAIEVQGSRFPVIECPADLVQQGNLTGGRCSAVLGDANGDRFLLTARHCVETVPLGGLVEVTCPACGATEKATVHKRGHLYLDIALLKRPANRCGCTFSPVDGVQYGFRGLQVRLHDGRPNHWRAATIKEGIGLPSAIINGARPQTFTIDLHSSHGKSGTAISNLNANAALVGSYSGALDVGTSPQTAVRQGFAHCADEAVRLFGSQLLEGYF
jgi:hypothetical protein